MSNEKRNLVPVRVALAKLGYGRSKLSELINEGKIIAYRMGQKTMIDADSIDTFHASLPRATPDNRIGGRTQRETA